MEQHLNSQQIQQWTWKREREKVKNKPKMAKLAELTTGDRSCPSTVSSCLRLDSFTTSDAPDFSGEEK